MHAGACVVNRVSTHTCKLKRSHIDYQRWLFFLAVVASSWMKQGMTVSVSWGHFGYSLRDLYLSRQLSNQCWNPSSPTYSTLNYNISCIWTRSLFNKYYDALPLKVILLIFVYWSPFEWHVYSWFTTHLPNLWWLVAHNALFAHQSVFELQAPKK